MKRALITGVTGMDGSTLAELLLGKGYEVHALRRRTSTFGTGRLDHLLGEWHDEARLPLHLHYGDLTDALSLLRLIRDVQPDEVYHLGAMSHVGVSFFEPEHTGDVDALGTTRMLDAIRTLGVTPRFYNAASSEMFGKVHEVPQRETTPFHPRSPYGVAKCYAYWMTQLYREAYGLFACNGILFNHESPTRGETFVTRKITRGLTRIYLGQQDCLYLGNLDALRDWGHSKDYVEAMWLMLQQPEPDDYVIATGEQHSVREFVEAAGRCLEWDVRWEGSGDSEVGIVGSRVVVRIDPQYKRPAEVDTLLGDSSKARSKLGWTPRHSFTDLVSEMVEHDLRLAEQEAFR